jgi:O-methyltransferase
VAIDERSGAELWAMAQLSTPMAVRVAATLRVADHIAAGLRTAEQLAPVVQADPDALERLLSFLVVRGLFSRDAGGRFALTEVGQALCDDHPAGKRALLDIEGLGRAELSFIGLLHSVRTGQAAFTEHFGHSFWEDLAADPVRAGTFDRWMAVNVERRLPGLVDSYDWASLGHLVDVGGGDGSLLIALLTRYRHLRGTVLDVDATAEAARRALAAAGLADRGGAVAGSFFDQVPAGADGYLLSWILHDWADEPARQILRRCAQAAGERGRVIVVESIRSDGRSPHTGMDLRMLAFYGGKERSVAELGALAADAALRVRQVRRAGGMVILELSAAGR